MIKAISKKPGKVDVKSMDFFQVDIDPRAGEDFAAEAERIRAIAGRRPPDGIPPPSLIVFSGGGCQLFWRLKEPIQINGDEALALEAERYNRELANVYEADTMCSDCCHVMRLPGTLNVLNAKKIKAGREPARAYLMGLPDSDRVYATNQFEQARTLAQDGPVDVGAGKPLGNLGALDLYAVGPRTKLIIENGRLQESKAGDDSDNAWLFDACCNLVRYDVPDAIIYSIITDSKWGISAHVLRQSSPDRCARKHIRDAREAVASGPLLLFKGVPMNTAREFVRAREPHLMHFNDDFLTFEGTTYVDLQNDTVKSGLWKFCETAQRPGKQKIIKPTKANPKPDELSDDAEYVPFNPNRTDVSEAYDALKGVVHRRLDAVPPPCWLDGRTDPAPRDILACRNGLMNLRTMEALPPAAEFFTRNALDFDFNADAPKAEQWHAFLHSLFGDDPSGQIGLLQEIMGYVLVPDLSQHKMFLLKGPPRAGKGTIAFVFERLVGVRNTCAPSMNSFGEKSGLEPLIGKQLAIVSDMRLGRQTDKAAVTENLLKISGEDPIDAFRKYKSTWHGLLEVRFLMLTNEDFALKDSSGALANRFVGITLINSFLGREDLGLKKKLLKELPGILLWAIEGRERLNERGHFAATKESSSIVRNLHTAGDPVAEFFHEAYELDPNKHISVTKVYEAYRTWTTEDGRDLRVKDRRTFGRDFLSCGMGKVVKVKRGSRNDRYWAYEGIKPITQGEDDEQDAS
ncbi:MAG: phage/plasmid primase, P4 family [Alphaproteobacteria bacterium]